MYVCMYIHRPVLKKFKQIICHRIHKIILTVILNLEPESACVFSSPNSFENKDIIDFE